MHQGKVIRGAERWCVAAALASMLVMLAGCEGGRAAQVEYRVYTGGDAASGKRIIVEKGCASCHTVPGIREAKGVVGPPLFFFSRRTYIAGELPNTPENLLRWVRSPQSVEPNTAMPNLGLTDQQARDVAAYLYTLR